MFVHHPGALVRSGPAVNSIRGGASCDHSRGGDPVSLRTLLHKASMQFSMARPPGCLSGLCERDACSPMVRCAICRAPGARRRGPWPGGTSSAAHRGRTRISERAPKRSGSQSWERVKFAAVRRSGAAMRSPAAGRRSLGSNAWRAARHRAAITSARGTPVAQRAPPPPAPPAR